MTDLEIETKLISLTLKRFRAAVGRLNVQHAGHVFSVCFGSFALSAN
jgi:hypothetical protein